MKLGLDQSERDRLRPYKYRSNRGIANGVSNGNNSGIHHRDDFLGNGLQSLRGVNLNGSMDDSSSFLDGFSQRTMSYDNLAEALGEGLAECMGDSLVEQLGLGGAGARKSILKSTNTKANSTMTSNTSNSTSTRSTSEVDNSSRRSRHSRRSASNHVEDSLHIQQNHSSGSHGRISQTSQQQQQQQQPQSTVFNQSQMMPTRNSSGRGRGSGVQKMQSIQFSKQNISYTSRNADGTGPIIVEPCNTPNPQLQVGASYTSSNGPSSNNGHSSVSDVNVNVNLNTVNIDSLLQSQVAESTSTNTRDMLQQFDSIMMNNAGRASAPPQLFESQAQSRVGGMLSKNFQQQREQRQASSSLQQRVRQINNSNGSVSIQRQLQQQQSNRVESNPNQSRTPIPSFQNSPAEFGVQLPTSSTPAAVSVISSHTPIPSFQNSPSKFGVQLPPSSTPAVDSVTTEDQAATDLSSFVWDSSNSNAPQKTIYPSRAIAIFGVGSLSLTEVKLTCEAFGSLLYFRSEFFASKGVLLIAYHDLRSARHAAKELKVYLQAIASGSNDIQLLTKANDIKVSFCVSLTASSEHDDSTLVISNLPSSISDKDISELVTSAYGAVRSIQFSADGSEAASENSCYIVEFYDIQEASQALLEIQNTAPWGNSTTVSLKMHQDHERKRGQDLFALIGRWRQGAKYQGGAASSLSRAAAQPGSTILTSISTQGRQPLSPTIFSQESNFSGAHSSSTTSTSHPQQVSYQPTPQLIVGPDGQYQYVMVSQGYPTVVPNSTTYGAVLPPQMHMQQPVQSHGTYAVAQPPVFDGQGGYWVQQSHPPMPNTQGIATYDPVTGQTVISHQHQPIIDVQHQTASVPIYAPSMPIAHMTDSSISSSANSASNGKRLQQKNVREENTEHLLLDIEAVKQGCDTRTSLMVRNIPNKYTQTMLLSEFSKSGHGPGKIDFFYLPIDFRNKCNRGYAFINFVDYRDIVSFHNTFNGNSWKVFRSEKICSITYARIQGKEGMMKRFQNSALLQKDQEYRPLVFSPDGQLADDE